MGKCRPLSSDEAEAMKAHTHNLRDRCLLIALEKTGYRSSEIASLKTEDVFDFTSKTIRPRVQVKAANMKKGVGRIAIPIHPDWRQALTLWLTQLQQSGYLRPGVPLWLSRKHVAKLFGLARETIWRIVRTAAARAGVDPDRVGCHSYRKLFCVRIYTDTARDIEKTRRIMGHKELSSTQQYLQSITDDEELERIIIRAAKKGVLMAALSKHDYPALFEEYDQRLAAGATPKDIRVLFDARGINWGTFQNRRTQAKKAKPATSEDTKIEAPVEVLPGQTSIQDTGTGVSAIADNNTVRAVLPIGNITPALTEALSPAEVQSLEHYERIIAQGLQTFVQVGQALMVIRDERLYRQQYGTFEEYLRQRWDLSRTYAHRMIDAAVVVEHLLPIGNTMPANEAQARPLTTVPPEHQQEVWQEVVETAPAGKITARHVQETVKRRKTAPNGTQSTTPKRFDVEEAEKHIRQSVMEWLRHCEDARALRHVQDFLSALHELVDARGEQLRLK